MIFHQKIGFSILTIIFLSINSSTAQNLVQNPSFELIELDSFESCEITTKRSKKCLFSDWTTVRGTPDIIDTSSCDIYQITPIDMNYCLGLVNWSYSSFDETKTSSEIVKQKLSKNITSPGRYKLTMKIYPMQQKVSQAIEEKMNVTTEVVFSNYFSVYLYNDTLGINHPSTVSTSMSEIFNSSNWKTFSDTLELNERINTICLGNQDVDSTLISPIQRYSDYILSYLFIDDITITAIPIEENFQESIQKVLPYFEISQYELTEEHIETLDLLFQLDASKIKSININAFSSSSGNEKLNRQLSLKRAESVKNFIENNLGIRNTQIRVNHFGEELSNPYQDKLTDRKVVVIIKLSN